MYKKDSKSLILNLLTIHLTSAIHVATHKLFPSNHSTDDHCYEHVDHQLANWCNDFQLLHYFTLTFQRPNLNSQGWSVLFLLRKKTELHLDAGPTMLEIIYMLNNK